MTQWEKKRGQADPRQGTVGTFDNEPSELLVLLADDCLDFFAETEKGSKNKEKKNQNENRFINLKEFFLLRHWKINYTILKKAVKVL